MRLNDSLYSILKWLAVIVLPAVATLYNVVAGLWGLPYAEEISKSMLALATCIGAVICVSTAEYNKDKP